jgi:hypothetical protein
MQLAEEALPWPKSTRTGATPLYLPLVRGEEKRGRIALNRAMMSPFGTQGLKVKVENEKPEFVVRA